MRRHAASRLALVALVAFAVPAWAQVFPDLSKDPESFKLPQGAFVPNPDGKPNTVTISAYNPVLSDSEFVEIALAKRAMSWGKRGDMGLYFPAGLEDASIPGGKRYFVFGDPAEQYIRSGNMIRGVATVGMPVDDFGSANWAKQISLVNGQHAVTAIAKTPAVKSALAAIAREKPALAGACKAGQVGDAGVMRELQAKAATNPLLAKAMSTMVKELLQPMAFVVHGFGTQDGSLHYGVFKRRANEARKATADKVVAAKLGDVMYDHFKNAPSKQGVLPRVFTANHCAGTYEDSDWQFVLENRLKKESPKLAKQVMGRIFAYDLGAGANKPEGVHHVAQIGARDMFGQINTPTPVMGSARMVKGNHMLNSALGEASADGLPALQLRPFVEAFGLRLYDKAVPGLVGKAAAAQRMNGLRNIAGAFAAASREQRKVLDDLRANSPAADKLWVTYQMAEANLRGHERIYAAQARRARALARVVYLRGKGAPKAEIEKAWREAKAAKAEARSAASMMRSTVSMQGIWRTLSWSDAIQYKGYVHGGQGTAKQKFLEQKLDKPGMADYARKAAAADQLFKAQLGNFYGRAAAAMQAVDRVFASRPAAGGASPGPR